jgi:hypothetical protein
VTDAPVVPTVADDADLRRPFRLGVLAVAIVFVFLGALLAAFGTGADRPEGVAERWLTDVGDTTRKGVRERAARQAEEVGPLALAADLLPTGDTDGRAAFIDLEVGKATTVGDAVEVPFRLHQRIDGEAGPPVDGTVVLVDGPDGWEVIALDPVVEGKAVPSEGGDPAAEAPLGLFAGTLVVAVLLTAGCSVIIRASGDAEPA